MPNAEEIVQKLRHAFRDAERPLTERDLTDGGLDGPYVVAHFLGKTRADIDRQTFRPSLHMEDFSYMTPRSLAYYLPPVLELMLIEPFDDELWIYLRGFLMSAVSNREPFDLSAPQREAIADWADHLAEAWSTTWELDPRSAEKLARRYRESLAASHP